MQDDRENVPRTLTPNSIYISPFLTLPYLFTLGDKVNHLNSIYC